MAGGGRKEPEQGRSRVIYVGRETYTICISSLAVHVIGVQAEAMQVVAVLLAPCCSGGCLTHIRRMQVNPTVRMQYDFVSYSSSCRHLPHGFFEQQLEGYFGQFGKVTKVRVSRNKRNAAPKGFAFLQFQHPEVATIAAESMDGYMMFGQKLRCHLIAPADLHAATFRHAHRQMRKKPWQKIAAERHNSERTPKQQQKREKRLLQADARRKNRIQKAGIAYEYEPLQRQHASKKLVFD